MPNPSNKYDIPELDLLAKEAMSAILQGIYSNPNMLEMMADISEKNKNSVNQEVAERAYLMAVAMIKRKERILKGVKE